jgi:hypothetical protein
MAKREMSTEQILRWLIEFGSDWVVVGKTLNASWAMSEIGFEEAVRQGDLDSNLNVYDGEPWKVKLSEQAIERLGERDAVF